MPCCSDIRRIHLSDLMLIGEVSCPLGKLGRSLPVSIESVEVCSLHCRTAVMSGCEAGARFPKHATSTSVCACFGPSLALYSFGKRTPTSRLEQPGIRLFTPALVLGH